jgi:Novel STAND NTPase 1
VISASKARFFLTWQQTLSASPRKPLVLDSRVTKGSQLMNQIHFPVREAPVKTVRIFVSSPGDVGAEREKAREIFDRLQMEFSGVLHIDPYFWEHEPLRAHTDPQTQTEPLANFDLCVCLLWARLGTRLYPGLHRKPDGSQYASGTEYEVLHALDAFRLTGTPEVLIYKRRDEPVIPLKPREERERVLSQYDALHDFLEQLTLDAGRVLVGVNSYAGLDGFEKKFEGDMRVVLKRFVPEGVAGSRTAPKSWTQGCPFRGLRHFDFEHAPVFFGRTGAIDEVLAALKQQAASGRAFVLVFGGSGVGKSSLVRAGVLPWLVKPGVIDGIGLWRRAVMRPNDVNEGDLLDALAAALMRDEGLPEIGSDGMSVAQVAALMRENPESIGMLIKGALSQAARGVQLVEDLEKQPRGLFALAIDQLEELFTVTRLAGQRDRFLRAIDALARSGYVWVLATLRSDFYPRCEESAIVMELKKGVGQYHLQPPDEIQLGPMIRFPAAAAGLLFEEDYKTGERLDDLLRDEAAKNPATLPHLEFLLEELYEQRDKEKGLLKLETYRALGGVKGALVKRAEESFQQTSANAQDSFDLVCRQLVMTTKQEGQSAVRRLASKTELEKTAGAPELIASLIADRLLIVDRSEEGVAMISLAHEEMLRSWTRLAQWVSQHRESLKIQAQVAEDASRWLENSKSPDYLYEKGLRLEKATQAMNSNFLSAEECAFVRESLSKVEKSAFRAVLVSGNGMLEHWTSLQKTYPELRVAVLQEALGAGDAATRVNAATLVSLAPVRELSKELLPLVSSDPDDGVRRAAAFSLIHLDQSELFAEITQTASAPLGDLGALAHIRIAADASEKPSAFENSFRLLNPWLRWKISSQAWRLRFKRSLPVFPLVLIPVIMLASLWAAAFKLFPGIFNFALSQADPSGAMAIFHAITAVVLYGGFITFGLTLYRLVFGTERGTKSFLHPIGAIAAGAISGFISGALLQVLIVGVFTQESLVTMGWIPESGNRLSWQFWRGLMLETHFFWPYIITGVALGIGMACMTNALRTSAKWLDFLRKQEALATAKQTLRLTRNISKIAFPYAWPIPVALLIGGLLTFYVLRSAASEPEREQTWREALLAGMLAEGGTVAAKKENLRHWKKSASGQALGIAGDCATQAVGGFFCVVGMGLGIIAIRKGVRIEPRIS